MKRTIIAFVAVLTTSIAYCQEPTTLKQENLKGNVSAVRSSSYVFSENFGNPTEGELRKIEITLFDQYGRAILYNIDDTDYGKCFGIATYKIDGENTVAEVSLLGIKKSLKELGTINELINNQVLTEIDKKKREIVYNNNIVVKYDILTRFYPAKKYELTYRKAAKLIENGTYECKLYDKSGQSYLDFKETYNTNGQLIELDNERQFNKVSSYNKDILISDAGKYQYNKKGQLVSYTQQKNSFRNKKEYVYNDHGDIIQISTLVSKDKSEVYNKTGEVIYNDYKYDEKGNWIYRIVSNGKQNLYIEKRRIDYCNTSEEIEEKVKNIYSIIPVTNIKNANEFGDFYDKYLKKYYVAVIPLVNYDPKYASVKNADKASVFIEVSFNDLNCYGRFNRRLVTLKRNDKISSIAHEINSDGIENMKYSYRNGKIIMNNDEYEIDSTGTLKNTTKNIIFKEGNMKEEINRFVGR